ncbi:MAG: hypothetical protein IPP57_05445 [Candidatus Obscuribacter sp.]|nr:hypothetical protein [Candidatus Obscuribacter sp.]MBK9770260.1 hypothetical protein [Candidatus Obscuribacter sp.]
MANQQTPILKWLIVILCLAGLGSGAVLDVLAKSKAKSKTSGKLAKPPQSFVQGLQEYQNNRFGPAAEKFEQADRSGYCNEMTHYYLALCYHNLNQTQRAIDHYSWVSSYAKSATLKYNAAVGYNAVARYAGNRTYAGNGGSFAGFSYRGGGGSSAGSSGGG